MCATTEQPSAPITSIPGCSVAGLYVAWEMSIAVLVAAYGRSKSRPFFPLLVTRLFIPFPLTLLAIAVTSTVGPGAETDVEVSSSLPPKRRDSRSAPISNESSGVD